MLCNNVLLLLLFSNKGHRLTWKQYHRLSDIHGFLDYLAVTYPAICSVQSIGNSHEGRPLKVFSKAIYLFTKRRSVKNQIENLRYLEYQMDETIRLFG